MPKRGQEKDKQLDETMKTIQDMKIDFNKDIEPLKQSQN